MLAFWFALTKEQQFAKDPDLDRAIADRFGAFVDDLVATDATHCWADPDTLLGAVVAIDQFGRNIHRGSARAFAGDDLAQWLTLHAIGKGWDERYSPERRVFLYLPLMHAEHRGLQALSVGLYERLGRADNLAFAVAHRDAIMAFGRFPGRNAALGRTTTADERAWLEAHGGGW